MSKVKGKVETTDEGEKVEPRQPTFGERLRAARRERKLTQKQIAEALGCQDSAIEFYESDAVQPTAETLAIIGKQFGVDIHELLTGKEAPRLTKEIEAVRHIKKQFRQILNEVRVRATELNKLDRLVKACIETIEAGINPPKARTEDDGGSEKK